MGNTKSRTEEVIIAQNGANSATTSQLEIEAKISTLNIIVMVVIACVALLYLYILFQHYKKHTRKIFRKEMSKSVSSAQQQV